MGLNPSKRLRRCNKWWRIFWSCPLDDGREARAAHNLRHAQRALTSRDRAFAREQEASMPDRHYPDPTPLVALCLARSGRSKERGP